jgi:hypothetical protein
MNRPRMLATKSKFLEILLNKKKKMKTRMKKEGFE